MAAEDDEITGGAAEENKSNKSFAGATGAATAAGAIKEDDDVFAVVSEVREAALERLVLPSALLAELLLGGGANLGMEAGAARGCEEEDGGGAINGTGAAAAVGCVEEDCADGGNGAGTAPNADERCACVDETGGAGLLKKSITFD